MLKGPVRINIGREKNRSIFIFIDAAKFIVTHIGSITILNVKTKLKTSFGGRYGIN